MLISIGMGLTFVPVTLIATTGVKAGDAGLASGLLNTSQQIGGALGLAILSTFATEKTTNVLADAGSNPSPTQESSALVDGFHVAFAGAAIFLAVGAVLLAVLLRSSDVKQVEQDEQVPLAA
jgi:hypothetical protein